MVRLGISLLDSFHYTARLPYVPFVAVVKTDETIEVSRKIDLRQVLFTNTSDSAVAFGSVSKCGLGIYRETISVSPSRPFCRLYEVFENEFDSDGSDLVPGDYELVVGIQMYPVSKTEGTAPDRPIVLEARRVVTII